MLLMERLADRLVLWGREFSLGLGSEQSFDISINEIGDGYSASTYNE